MTAMTNAFGIAACIERRLRVHGVDQVFGLCGGEAPAAGDK